MIKNWTLIKALKRLYKKNIEFLKSLKNGTSERKYSAITIIEYEKANAELKGCIDDLRYGFDCETSLSEWHDVFSEILIDDCHLYNNMFPIGGKLYVGY